MDSKSVLHFIFELGQLRFVKHEGWHLIGQSAPESVAEHSLRAAQLGYLLACMEKYENPYEVCAMLIFHDIAEARTGDFHRISKRYSTIDEQSAVKEQTAPLGEPGSAILRKWQETENRSSTAGIIAKDADELEQAVTAKEYVENGYSEAIQWINNVEAILQTASAKTLIAELRTASSLDWWRKLERAA